MSRLRLIAAAVLMCIASLGFAQSAKNAVQLSDVSLLNWTGSNTEWGTILSSVIKTSQQKDLMIGVSLETGLYTRTLVKSKTGTSDTSLAGAGLEVRVLVDGMAAAYPGIVQFEKRSQQLSATLGGILSGWTDLNGDGVITPDEYTWTDEQIELILDTMAAHSFNFAIDNMSAGQHVIQVQARVAVNTTVQTGQAEAKATIGKGSVTVEEVRLVKDADILL